MKLSKIIYNLTQNIWIYHSVRAGEEFPFLMCDYFGYNRLYIIYYIGKLD